ncbi:MAG: hypothetical protein WB626_03615 [Bacteroidota bacterium]
MAKLTRIPIPSWAYEVALGICLARQKRYRHQFITKKLKDIAGDDEMLKKDIEGVIGYVGDISACLWFGLDPKEELRSMIVDTELLAHRDEYDVLFRGWRVDVKTEIYPAEKFERAITKELGVKETYGCRLININHFLENSGSVDKYVFATIDDPHPQKARYWIPIGWVDKSDVTRICPEPKSYTPSGARLWTKAYIIPNLELRDLQELTSLEPKPGVALLTRSSTDEKIDSLGRDKYNALLGKVGLS